MKNIVVSYNLKLLTKVFLLLITTFILVSCEDLLEENPKAVVAENFYSNPEEFEAAVNAIYLPLKAVWEEFTIRIDTHTDWGYGRGGRAILTNVQGFASIDQMSYYWGQPWLAIRNANLVIANSSNSSTAFHQDKINMYIAEAKFLRAYSYFLLVRNWGGLPLRTEENMNERDIPRSSVNDIYEIILNDLFFAEEYLPDVPVHFGRPMKNAAKTMLADV